jgi:hypothetical protein
MNRIVRHSLRILGVVVVLFCGALAAVASVYSGGSPDRISVRLFDGTTGKPMAGVPILLGVPAGNSNANQLRDITDSQGTARFSPSDPIPDQINLILGPDVRLCPSWTFTTEQILKTGVIADNKCRGTKFEYSGHPTPGELVVFARRVSLWERIRREL